MKLHNLQLHVAASYLFFSQKKKKSFSQKKKKRCKKKRHTFPFFCCCFFSLSLEFDQKKQLALRPTLTPTITARMLAISEQ